MFLGGKWYRLEFAKPARSPADPARVAGRRDPAGAPARAVLGIADPRTDKRIDFVGGIRGLGELERRVKEVRRRGIRPFPTSVDQLMSVADAGLVMPPKCTWFEPKLRSGLFVHPFE